MNDLKLKILEVLRDLQCHENSDDEGDKFYLNDDETPLLSYKNLEKQISVGKARLQVEMKEMRDDGFVELTIGVDGDYIPSGSGWMLTGKGVKIVNHLAAGKPVDELLK